MVKGTLLKITVNEINCTLSSQLTALGNNESVMSDAVTATHYFILTLGLIHYSQTEKSGSESSETAQKKTILVQ